MDNIDTRKLMEAIQDLIKQGTPSPLVGVLKQAELEIRKYGATESADSLEVFKKISAVRSIRKGERKAPDEVEVLVGTLWPHRVPSLSTAFQIIVKDNGTTSFRLLKDSIMTDFPIRYSVVYSTKHKEISKLFEAFIQT
jgi:hypothetical protein